MLPLYSQWVGSIDMKANEHANANVIVKQDSSWQEQVNFKVLVLKKIRITI